MSALPVLVTFFITEIDSVLLTGLISLIAVVVVLGVSAFLFERKQF